MRANALLVLGISLAIVRTPARADPVSFRTSDGGSIIADQYGSGSEDVILAHGGRYDKESWKPQAQLLAAAGFHVLAIDFRGYGRSYGPGQTHPDTAPYDRDILAAAAFARSSGARSVAVIGASLGATAAGDAAIDDPAHSIDRLVLLSESPSRSAALLRVPVIFIVSRDDVGADGPRLLRIESQYRRIPGPKRLIILRGSAHGQEMFRTNQASSIMAVIIPFLRRGSIQERKAR